MFLALVSQRATSISIEIISDNPSRKSVISHVLSNYSSETLQSETDNLGRNKLLKKQSTRSRRLLDFLGISLNNKESRQAENSRSTTGRVHSLITIQSLKEFTSTCQVAFVTQNKLLITVNGEMFSVNFKQFQLTRSKSRFSYGIQQINMGLFCTILRVKSQDSFLVEEIQDQQKLSQLMESAR